MKELLPEELKDKLYRYKNGRAPANIYNVYTLMIAYEHEFGLVGKDCQGKNVCIRAGAMCRTVGQIIGYIEFSRIKCHVCFLINSEPSTETVKRVVGMLGEDFLVMRDEDY